MKIDTKNIVGGWGFPLNPALSKRCAEQLPFVIVCTPNLRSAKRRSERQIAPRPKRPGRPAEPESKVAVWYHRLLAEA